VPHQAPEGGFVWIYLEREQLGRNCRCCSAPRRRWAARTLLDLHVKDLSNRAHPSHYDYTSVYDLVIFRRLATEQEVQAELGDPPGQGRAAGRVQPHPHARRRLRGVRPAADHGAPGALLRRPAFIERYLSDAVQAEGLTAAARSRLPTSAADLMLRMLNLMVDSYLDLRKELSAELDRWQQELLATRAAAAPTGAR
jgi:magnesium transporter